MYLSVELRMRGEGNLIFLLCFVESYVTNGETGNNKTLVSDNKRQHTVVNTTTIYNILGKYNS